MYARMAWLQLMDSASRLEWFVLQVKFGLVGFSLVAARLVLFVCSYQHVWLAGWLLRLTVQVVVWLVGMRKSCIICDRLLPHIGISMCFRHGAAVAFQDVCHKSVLFVSCTLHMYGQQMYPKFLCVRSLLINIVFESGMFSCTCYKETRWLSCKETQ